MRAQVTTADLLSPADITPLSCVISLLLLMVRFTAQFTADAIHYYLTQDKLHIFDKIA